MGPPGIVVLGVLLGLLVAAGLLVALARGGRERRKPLLAALIAVLVLTAVGGAAWVRAGRGSPAPVDANLTLFTQTNALYAVRAKSGSVRWEVVEPKPTYFIGSAPLFHDGVVYAYTSAGPADTIGSTVPYLLTAWRGRDGAPLWHTRILTPCCGAPLTYVADGQLVVLTYDAVGSDGHLTWGLMRLRASDGAMLGMISLPTYSEVPVIVDNTVYQCQHSGTIMALRLSDGALVWRSSAYESTFTDCALKEADGVVFASILALKSNGTAAGETGQLLALNASNGQVLWRYTTPATNLLAVGDGLVVLGEGNPHAPTSLVALRAGDGSIAWRHGGFPPQLVIKGGDIPARSVAIGDGLVLVGGGGFTLWALRASDGSTAWQMKEDHHSFQTIGIVDGTVFVRSLFAGGILASPFVDSGSYVLALRARDGAPYWKASLGAGGLVMGRV